MARTRTLAQTAADVANHRGSALLIELLFTGGPLRLCLAPWPLPAGGHTYAATGNAVSVEAHVENADGAEGLRLTLSGVNPAIFELVHAEPYQGRLCRLLEQRFNADHAPVGEPTAEFIGRMVELSYHRAFSEKTATVTLAAEHFDAAAQRVHEIRFSDAEQRRRYPADGGCQYAASLVEKIVSRK